MSCERTSERTRMNEAYGTTFNGPFHNDDSDNGQNIELTLEFVTFITCRLGPTDDDGKRFSEAGIFGLNEYQNTISVTFISFSLSKPFSAANLRALMINRRPIECLRPHGTVLETV